MNYKKNFFITCPFFLGLILIILFVSKAVYGQVFPINATIQISVCGNNIVEDGEDCESSDLNSRTCQGVGYAGGNLTCDISCSFDATSCIVPSIDSSNVAPDDVDSLLAGSYFAIPQTASIVSTPSLTTTDEIIINIPTSNGTNSIVLPDNLVITKSGNTNFDPTGLLCADVLPGSLSGFSSDLTVDGALQWGILGENLEFSEPIMLNIFVGTSLNGQTLNVVRSTNTSSGWTSNGIVAPATCIVSAGSCSFQATKASYFATTRTLIVATPTPTSTITPTLLPTSTPTPGSSSTSQTSSSTPSSTPTPVSLINLLIQKMTLPDMISLFDIDKSGKIEIEETYNVVRNWVNEWKEFLVEEVYVISREEKTRSQKGILKCDFNYDGICNIKDFSVLLYYIGV